MRYSDPFIVHVTYFTGQLTYFDCHNVSVGIGLKDSNILTAFICQT